ncbi:penicillin-binding protein 2 [Paenibacillus sp. FJAT-26967]|uniref:peptidoglycan D,D-transpeptidase FtsI family protein n=1 Tax=Paenibacillus sp. FJAT-26967 TaxID=1729690 RepID=UPI0008389A3B|nr:penicillin-binding transpeptidase domain-containing protein [Paenibacillus sp. FJAT-26967]
MDNEDIQKKDSGKRHFSIRINLFFFATFLLFSVLIVKLAILQFVEGEKLAEEEHSATNRETPIAPIRGNIYDSNSYPIAYTIPVQSVFFRIESGQKDKDEVIAFAHKLADIFQQYGSAKSKQTPLTAAAIVELMDVGYDIDKNKTKEPSYYSIPRRIKADLSKEEVAYLLEHRDEFKWVEVMEESIRTYDEDKIAVQLTGYMRQFSTARESKYGLSFYKDKTKTEEYLDTEDVGYDGLELMYQEELRGKNGYKTYPVNSSQKIIGNVTITKPEKGNNLHLTIHKDIQTRTEQKIMDQLTYLRQPKSGSYGYSPNARSGYAVAMEVDTGRVITMASMPDYDPNLWTGGIKTTDYVKIQPFVNNGTITTAYPDYPEKELRKHANSMVYMGSTIKPLTVLVGLKEGFFKPQDRYNDTGSYSFGKQGSQSTIWNSGRKAWGPINAAQALEHSSNTYMSAWIGSKLYFERKNGLQLWDDYLKRFGLTTSTQSGLPNEYAGSNESIANAALNSAQSALIYASWGQNEKATTLQLAQHTAMLATQGKRLKPQFVDKITTYDGEIVKKFGPEILSEEKSFKQEYWDTIFAGMKRVKSQGFDNVNYTFASKTGTSTQQIGTKMVDNGVFIAFAPADKPKLAVAVVIPEGGYGSWSAAPIAREIFDAYDEYIGLSGTPRGPATGNTDKKK